MQSPPPWWFAAGFTTGNIDKKKKYRLRKSKPRFFWDCDRGYTCIYIYIMVILMNNIYIYIHISYMGILTWIKAILGWFLLLPMIPGFGRDVRSLDFTQIYPKFWGSFHHNEIGVRSAVQLAIAALIRGLDDCWRHIFCMAKDHNIVAAALIHAKNSYSSRFLHMQPWNCIKFGQLPSMNMYFD